MPLLINSRISGKLKPQIKAPITGRMEKQNAGVAFFYRIINIIRIIIAYPTIA